MSITYRSQKGSKLTSAEVDANFAYLDQEGNKITINSGFTVTGQDIEMAANYEWKIQGITYTNATAVTITIPYAAAGMKRTDLIVANTSNSFERIAGIESASNPATPSTLGRVVVTTIDVTDGTVAGNDLMIYGGDYVKKSFAPGYAYPSITGADAVIPLPANGASTIIVNNFSLISIAGFDLSLITGNPNAEDPYPGKEYTLENQTNNNVTLKHLSSVAIEFFALDKTDLIIPPGKSVRFNYGGSLVKETFKNWSSVIQDIESQFKGHLYLMQFGGAINFIGFYAYPTLVGSHTGFSASFSSTTLKPLDSWNRRRVFLQVAGTYLTAEYYFPYVFCSVGTGFYYKVNIAFYYDTPRKFVGLNSSIIASGNVEPSTLTNCIMVAKDSTDSNFHLMHNDNSGTCTKIDLGSDFSTTGTVTKGLRFEMWNYKGDNSVNVRITNLRDNIVYETVISTDLPTELVGLSPRQGINTASENITGGFEISDLKIQLQN